MIATIPDASLTKAKYTILFKDIKQDNKEIIEHLCLTFDSYVANLDPYEYDILDFTGSLYYHLLYKYRYYEINDDDENVFVQCIKDSFGDWEEYYKKKFNVYLQSYNLKLDNLKKTTRLDNIKTTNQNMETNNGSVNSSGKSGENSNSNNNSIGTNDNSVDTASRGDTTTNVYDLPNKQINPSSENGYITDKTIVIPNTDVNETSKGRNTMSSVSEQDIDRDYQDKQEVENRKTSTNEHDTDYDSDMVTIYGDKYLTLKKQYLSMLVNLYDEFASKFADCFLHIY